MVKLALKDMEKLKDITARVGGLIAEALDRCTEGEEGPIFNPAARIHIRSVRSEIEDLRGILDVAEDVAARGGDLEGERQAETLLEDMKAAFEMPAEVSNLGLAVDWLKKEIERVNGLMTTADELIEGLKTARDSEKKNVEIAHKEIEYLRGILTKIQSHIEAGPAHEELTAASMLIENLKNEFMTAERMKAHAGEAQENTEDAGSGSDN